MAIDLKLTWPTPYPEGPALDYSLDFESITAREYDTIETETGLNPGQFGEMFQGGTVPSGKVTLVMAWLMFHRRDPSLKLADVDVPLMQFWTALGNANAGQLTVTPGGDVEGKDPTPEPPSTETGS